jgi:superfamily II DNA or RNA helicase
LFTVDRNVFDATVEGTHPWPEVVRIVVPNSRQTRVVRAACTCDSVEPGVCGHIWGTLLQLDAQELYKDVPGDHPLRLTMSDRLLEELLDELDEDDDDDASALGGLPAALVEPKRAAPPTLPQPKIRSISQVARPSAKGVSWRQALQHIQSVRAHVASSGTAPVSSATPYAGAKAQAQAWYVVDLPATAGCGRLTIRIFHRLRRQDGAYGKLKSVKVNHDRLSTFADEADRNVLRFVLDARLGDFVGRGYYNPFSPEAKEFRVSRDLCGFLLPRLCASGRLVMPSASLHSSVFPAVLDEQALQTMRWEDGSPWRLQLKISRATPDGATAAPRDSPQPMLCIEGHLRRGDEVRQLTEPLLALVDGLIFWPDAISLFDATEAGGWISTLYELKRLLVPEAEAAQLVEQMARMPSAPDIHWDDDTGWQHKVEKPRPRLEISAPSASTAAALHADVRFVYGDRVVDPQHELRILVDSSAKAFVRRSTEAESAALRQLDELGVRERHRYIADPGARAVQPADLPRVASQLTEAGWEVLASGGRLRTHGLFNFTVTSGIDWFDLEGRLEFDGGVSASLTELLAAVARGERFVRLGDGSHGMLPEEWLQRHAPWLQLGQAAGERVRFVPAQAMVLDALLRDAPRVSLDARFARARDELRDFAGVQPADPTRAFAGALREYQRLGLGWLQFLQRFGLGGCLADDMGLGKTVQVLALLAARHVSRSPRKKKAPAQPSLVVAPRSVVHNWIEEAHRFAPDLRVLDYTGLDRGSLHPQFSSHDVVITTYGTLRRDVVTLKDVAFDYVILDEAQAIKNASSQSAKAARLLPAAHRLALTGTPVENHLGELWSIFEFLNPGMLNAKLLQHVSAPANGRYAGPAGDAGMLGWALRPFILRRTKERVLSELPQKTEQTLFCEMDSHQRRLYVETRDYYRAKLTAHIEANTLGRSKIQVLEALLRLRQIACHPSLVSQQHASVTSAKVETLIEQLDQVISEGHKALVFSQFTKFLGIVRGHVTDRGWSHQYLDGRTHDRKQRVDSFQNDPDCRLFLISLKAGGLGLNLTAADYVFILDPWWNPAVEAQAVDRAHRMGQVRPVFAYRLICRDTVEERILELQSHKKNLAESILANDGSILRNLTGDDLRILLS